LGVEQDEQCDQAVSQVDGVVVVDSSDQGESLLLVLALRRVPTSLASS